jgi:hypothetical protein
MSRIDHALNPTDAASVLSALEFDTNWLLELSNADPAQFLDHADRLYSIMNRMQLVTSRFARVCNDTTPEYERDLAVLREVLES